MGKPLYLVVSDPADGPLGPAIARRAPTGARGSRTPSPSRARTGDGPPLCWVIGGGGLLGRHVTEALDGRGDGPGRFGRGSDRMGATRAARPPRSSGRPMRFLDRAARSGAPWRLMWCAGAGVVSTSPEALAQETRLVRPASSSALADRLSREPGLARAGSVLVASSAGGVYSASPAAPPFHEGSPTGCLAPYGREKLAQEDLFEALRARLLRRPAGRAVLQPLRPRPEPVEGAGAHLARRARGPAARARVALRPARHDPRLPVRRGRRPHGGRRARAAGGGAAGTGPGTAW